MHTGQPSTWPLSYIPQQEGVEGAVFHGGEAVGNIMSTVKKQRQTKSEVFCFFLSKF